MYLPSFRSPKTICSKPPITTAAITKGKISPADRSLGTPTAAAVGVPRDLSAGEILPLVMAAVVIGGLLQIVFGLLKLGKYITLVP